MNKTEIKRFEIDNNENFISITSGENRKMDLTKDMFYVQYSFDDENQPLLCALITDLSSQKQIDIFWIPIPVGVRKVNVNLESKSLDIESLADISIEVIYKKQDGL